MNYKIQTIKPQQFIDITHKVAEEVKKSSVRDGIAVICAAYNGRSHNKRKCRSGCCADMISALDKAAPYTENTFT